MQRRDDGQGRYGRPAYGPQQDQAWEQQPIYEARPMDQMDDPYAGVSLRGSAPGTL